MADYAKSAGIDYPIAIDVDSATTTAFGVDSYPDYYVIDRAGNLRVADLANADLERTVEALLKEKPPSAVPAVLAKASATAAFKDKRILVMWGSQDELQPVEASLESDRDLGELLRYEYELVRIDRTAQPELAAALGVGEGPAALTALDAGGKLLGRLVLAQAEVGASAAFLELHRVPIKDAKVLWNEALARAQLEKKRILVHLGAPW